MPGPNVGIKLQRKKFSAEEERSMWDFFLKKLKSKDPNARHMKSGLWAEYRVATHSSRNDRNLESHFRQIMFPKLFQSSLSDEELQCVLDNVNGMCLTEDIKKKLEKYFRRAKMFEKNRRVMETPPKELQGQAYGIKKEPMSPPLESSSPNCTPAHNQTLPPPDPAPQPRQNPTIPSPQREQANDTKPVSTSSSDQLPLSPQYLQINNTSAADVGQGEDDLDAEMDLELHRTLTEESKKEGDWTCKQYKALLRLRIQLINKHLLPLEGFFDGIPDFVAEKVADYYEAVKWALSPTDPNLQAPVSSYTRSSTSDQF